MTDTADNVSPSPKAPRARRRDRIEVVKVLVLAVVSFLAGFGLVFLFLTPSSGDEDAPEIPAEAPALAPEAAGDAGAPSTAGEAAEIGRAHV